MSQNFQLGLLPALCRLSLGLIVNGIFLHQTAAAESADAATSESTLSTITIQANKQEPSVTGKTSETLREIPQSVSVISQERIEQQALATLDDVMLQTTGVTREQLWLNNNYYARGLKIENIRYDGGSTSAIQDRNNNTDLAQYETVSILRGADGLFGAGEAGGVINLISKRPKAEQEFSAALTAGRWNNYRAELDATSALNTDQSIRGRAVAVLQDQDFFYEPTHSQRKMVYGALDFDLGPLTTLLTGLSYQLDKADGFNASLPRYQDGSDIGLSRNTTTGAPWGWMERESQSIYAILQHEINTDWKAQLNLRYNHGNDGINTAELEDAINVQTKQATWWRYQDDTSFEEITADLNLQGGFDAFNQHHNIIIGVDFSNNEKDYKQNWVRYGTGSIVDLNAPPEWQYPPADWDTLSTNTMQQASTYGSLRIHPIENLALIAGGRYTFDQQTKTENHKLNYNDTYKTDNKFVPYFGLTYDATPQATLYASFAEIYKPQGNYLQTLIGPTLPPSTGKNYELGIKSQLFDDRLLASLALFTIKKEKGAVNIDWQASKSTSMCCYIATGSKESQGIDFEINGNINTDWNVFLGYTFNENEEKSNAGDAFSTITPKHLLKLWTNYRLHDYVQGLSVGGGVTAQTSTYVKGGILAFNPASENYDGAWTDYDFKQGGYAVWSLRAAYDINESFNIAANLNNIFDKTYYSTVGTAGYGNFYGEPRNLLVTLRYQY